MMTISRFDSTTRLATDVAATVPNTPSDLALAVAPTSSAPLEFTTAELVAIKDVVVKKALAGNLGAVRLLLQLMRTPHFKHAENLDSYARLLQAFVRPEARRNFTGGAEEAEEEGGQALPRVGQTGYTDDARISLGLSQMQKLDIYSALAVELEMLPADAVDAFAADFTQSGGESAFPDWLCATGRISDSMARALHRAFSTRAFRCRDCRQVSSGTELVGNTVLSCPVCGGEEFQHEAGSTTTREKNTLLRYAAGADGADETRRPEKSEASGDDATRPTPPTDAATLFSLEKPVPGVPLLDPQTAKFLPPKDVRTLRLDAGLGNVTGKKPREDREGRTLLSFSAKDGVKIGETASPDSSAPVGEIRGETSIVVPPKAGEKHTIFSIATPSSPRPTEAGILVDTADTDEARTLFAIGTSTPPAESGDSNRSDSSASGASASGLHGNTVWDSDPGPMRQVSSFHAPSPSSSASAASSAGPGAMWSSSAPGSLGSPTSGHELPPGTRIGNWEILNLAGRGSMGEVYKAINPHLDQFAAIKVIGHKMLRDDVQVRRFEEEALNLARINHPNIVAVKDFGSIDGRPYISLQWIDGGSLDEKIKRDGPLAIPEFLDVAIQCAKGLEVAHLHGIVHRDVKPENILIGIEDRRVKITDFGLAKSNSMPRDLTGTGDFVGTPAYMSPEQIQGDDVTHAADIYSLGATFFHLLTGRAPFKAKTVAAVIHMHLAQPFPSARQFNLAVPDAVDVLLSQMAEKKPADRPSSLRAVIDELERIQAELKAALQDVSTVNRRSRSRLPGASSSSSSSGSGIAPVRDPLAGINVAPKSKKSATQPPSEATNASASTLGRGGRGAGRGSRPPVGPNAINALAAVSPESVRDAAAVAHVTQRGALASQHQAASVFAADMPDDDENDNAHRRRRGPWVIVAVLVIVAGVGVGFGVAGGTNAANTPNAHSNPPSNVSPTANPATGNGNGNGGAGAANQPESRPQPPPNLPVISGFSWLRSETFSGNQVTHTVEVFRFEPFAQAMGLGADETHPACEFVLIPGGEFTMGSPRDEPHRADREGPQRRITVQPFLLARTEVTQLVWRRIALEARLPARVSEFVGATPDSPAENMNYQNAVDWSASLGLRLPSEAEWEYACRAGTTTATYAGPLVLPNRFELPEGAKLGWYMGNADADYEGALTWRGMQYDPKDDPPAIYAGRKFGVHPVAQFPPNPFGLFDMLGNVREFCADSWHPDLSNVPTDGTPWHLPGAGEIVVRGGSIVRPAHYMRSAVRENHPNRAGVNRAVGLRPARSIGR